MVECPRCLSARLVMMRLHETSTLMTAAPAPQSLYAMRWKTFLIALFFAGFLLVDLLKYCVWPPPSATATPWAYQEPGKMIVFIAGLLILAPAVAVGLYWTLTPRPLLQLSATSLVYRPFPRATRTIVWDDVEQVIVYHDATRQGRPATRLTLWCIFKPPLWTDRALKRRQMDINLQLLSLSADELIELIGTYHHVHTLRTPKNPQNAQAARTTGRGDHNDHNDHNDHDDSSSTQER